MRFGPRKLLVRMMEPADNARNGAGSGAASGSEPYDDVGAVARYLDAEGDNQRSRRRAAADAPNDERHTPASHEAGDNGGELEDGAAGPDDDDPDGPDADPNDPDADDPDAGDEPDATLLKRKLRVKVDGVDLDVTVDELRSGYQRHQDYTRKTQELAVQRQQYEQGQGVILAQHQALDAGLQQMQAAIAAQMPQRPSAQEWDALFHANPVEAMRLQTQFAESDRRMAEIDQHRAANAAQARNIATAQHQQRIGVEAQKLLAARPDLRDPARVQEFQRQIVDYATSAYGFTPQEIGAVIDHRHLAIIDKARRYDEAVRRSQERPRQRNAENVNTQARQPRPAAPGPAAGQQRSRPNQAVQAQQRLAKSGRVDDAAAAIAAILD